MVVFRDKGNFVLPRVLLIILYRNNIEKEIEIVLFFGLWDVFIGVERWKFIGSRLETMITRR